MKERKKIGRQIYFLVTSRETERERHPATHTFFSQNCSKLAIFVFSLPKPAYAGSDARVDRVYRNV